MLMLLDIYYLDTIWFKDFFNDCLTEIESRPFYKTKICNFSVT